MKTINLGIDLGTTNSAIAYFNKGEVEVFKDPVSWKETIPSVIAFKKDRIIIGQKAKEFMEKAPHSIAAFFKRKMGTNEIFNIKSVNKSYTPIELSSFILKELRGITQNKIPLDSAVITIPASFDTIQSNATKKAGELAGFKEVVLLQEPIAASLAYVNGKNKKLDNTKWLVYDLGGGTFDVALVEIKNSEMKIIDHEGDNFLGGSDFDREIIEKIVIPYLENEFNLNNLLKEFQNLNGSLNKVYYRLLYLAEQAKIQLSTKESADIEFDFEYNGIEDEIYLTIQRSKFENIIKNHIEKTTKMIHTILTRNNLLANDINFVLMVGGSTYIPFVRKFIEKNTNIKVVTDIDPTTAVAVGAAYYAGSKQSKIEETSKKTIQKVNIKLVYEKNTQDKNVFLAGRIENPQNYKYRIIRNDRGFDSGTKPLKEKIAEELIVVENSYNYFDFFILDEFNNIIQKESIEITHGKFSIAGQPLPEDISLEVDDINGDTKLELIFQKNSTLPLKRTVTKELNKTIQAGSSDSFIINVLEGDSNTIPEANKTIGFLKISGFDIDSTLYKGSDIEIKFEMSESRELTISAYLPTIDQEFKEIFNPKERAVEVDKLEDEIELLEEKIEKSINFENENLGYTEADELFELKLELQKVKDEVRKIDNNDSTDKKYQIEDKKRDLANKYFSITKYEKINKIKFEFNELKEEVSKDVYQFGDYVYQKIFEEIVEKEKAYLNSNNIIKIEELLDELRSLKIQLLWKNPDFIKSIFVWLAKEEHNFKDSMLANALIGKGMNFFENNNISELEGICRELMSLLPMQEQEKANRIGFY